MTDPNWDAGIEKNISAKPTHGNWTLALDYVDASKRLKFVVSDERDIPAAAPLGPGQPQAPAAPAAAQTEPNKWTYAQGSMCTADGDPKAPLNPANCLITDAPPGALIAKIGGSVAGKTSDGLKSFVVGSLCVYDTDATTKGILYLTMNADPMGLSERSGSIRVKIYRSP
jgi:hypothetical protein